MPSKTHTKENSQPSFAIPSSSNARLKSNAILSTPILAKKTSTAWGTAKRTPSVPQKTTAPELSTPKHHTTASGKSTNHNSTLILPYRHSSTPCTLIFTRSNQTLFLRLRNEAPRTVSVSLLSLPTTLGFSTREVKWEVQAMSDELISVTWRGTNECKDTMVLQVNGESQEIRVALRARLRQGVNDTPQQQGQRDHTSTPNVANFRTPLAQIKNHTAIPPSSTQSNATTFSTLMQTPFGSAQKFKQFQMETQMLRPEQPASRLEALQMEIQKQKHQQKQWIAALPIHIDDLKEEIARLRRLHKPLVAHLNIGTHLRDTTYNAKLRLLLVWAQIIFALSGIDGSKLDPSDDSIVFQLIVNAYRSQPKPVREFLTAEQLKRLSSNASNNDSMDLSDDDIEHTTKFPQESDSWMNRFMLTIGLEEYEIPPASDKKRATQISTLCHKLLEKRKNAHLMNILLFVQNNVRRNVVQWGEVRRQRAATKIQRRMRTHIAAKRYKQQRECILHFQCAFRSILAQQDSEVYRSVLHVRALQSIIRREQTMEKTKSTLACVLLTQNRLESLCCSMRTTYLVQGVQFTQNHARFAAVWPAKDQQAHVICLQSSVRSMVAQNSCQYLHMVTQWTQSNVRAFVASVECETACKRIMDVQRSVRRNLTPTIEHDSHAVSFVQSRMRMMLCLSKYACASSAVTSIQSLQRTRNDMTSTLNNLHHITRVQASLRTVHRVFESEKQYKDIISVQAQIRQQLCTHTSENLVCPVVALQSCIRQRLSSVNAESKNQAIVSLQSIIRTAITVPIDAHSTCISTAQALLRAQQACTTTHHLLCGTIFAQSQLRSMQQTQLCENAISSIISLQSLIRTNQQVQHHTRLVQSTTHVQSKIRYFHEMYRSLKMHNQVKRTQKALCRSVAFRRTSQMWNSVLNTQSLLRMALAPRIEQQSSAVCTTQGCIRSHLECMLISKQLAEITSIQSLERSSTTAATFMDAIENVTMVQSHLRTAVARRDVDVQIDSTCFVQSKLRQLQNGLPVVAQQFLVRRTQDHLRMQMACNHTMYQLGAAVFAQRLARRYLVPSQQADTLCVQLVQSQIRSQLVQTQIQEAYHNVNQVQNLYRSQKDINMTMEALLRTENFQRAVRTRLITPVYELSKRVCICQSLVRSAFSQQNTSTAVDAVIHYQSLVRTGQEWSDTQRQFAVVSWVQKCIRQQIVTPASKESNAVSSVQSLIRSQLLSLETVQNIAAITTLQTLQRSHSARNKLFNTTRTISFVQSHLRSAQAVSLRCPQIASISLVQSTIRSHLTSQSFTSKQRAALKIQSTWKSYVAGGMRKYIIELVRNSQATIRRNLVPPAVGHVKSVINMQSVIRSIQQQRHTVFLSNSVMPLQSLQRSSHQAQVFSQCVCAIVNVQSVLRSNSVQSMVHARTSSIKIIQRQIKRIVAEQEFQWMAQSVVNAQSCSRQKATLLDTQLRLESIRFCQQNAASVRSELLLSNSLAAVIMLQSGIRCVQAVAKSQLQRSALCFAQSAAHGTLHQSAHFSKISAVVAAQNQIRSHTQQESLREMSDKVLLMQNLARANEASLNLDQDQERVTSVQSQVRSLFAQISLRQALKAVNMIQTFHRENCKATSEREQFQRNLLNITQVQSSLRGLDSILGTSHLIHTISCYQRHAQMKHTVNALAAKKKSIVLCQQYIRGAGVKAQAIEDVANFVRSTRAAINIQRFFRGYYSRTHLFGAQQRKLTILLQKVREEFEERKRIELKTRAGLRVLLKSKKMSSAMKACADLDHATSVSTKSCESMCNEEALLQLMFLIKSCNRSEPHVKLLIHILNILTSVSKDVYRADHVFNTKDCIDILVEQLQMYRDKPEVFLRAMKILQLLVIPKDSDIHGSPRYQRMEKMKEMTGTIGRMHGVAAVLEGKYKLEKKFQETQRAQLSRQSLSRNRLSIGGAASRRMSVLPNTSATASPVVLCYESLVTFLRKIEGKIALSETKTEDQLTIEDRRLAVSARRATITPSQALEVLQQASSRRESFVAPLAPPDRRASIAPPSARRSTMSSRRSLSTEKSRPSIARPLKKKRNNDSFQKPQ